MSHDENEISRQMRPNAKERKDIGEKDGERLENVHRMKSKGMMGRRKLLSGEAEN